MYELPTLDEIKQYAKENLDSLWEEYKRDLNPQKYPVDLSTDCWNHKMNLLEKVRKDVKHLTETVNKGILRNDNTSRKIIQELGVLPTIDPKEEVRKSIDFLKAYLTKHPF